MYIIYSIDVECAWLLSILYTLSMFLSFVNLAIYLHACLAVGHKTESMYNKDGMHGHLSPSDT